MVEQSPPQIPALIYQCPLCKNLTLLKGFTKTVTGIVITCASCGGSFHCAETASNEDGEVPSWLAAKKGVAFVAEEERVSSPAMASFLAEDEATNKPQQRVGGQEYSQSVDVLSVGEEAASFHEQGDFGEPTDSESAVDAKAEFVNSMEDASCPKCWAPRSPGLEACTRCGLVFANIGVTFHKPSEREPTSPQEAMAQELWEGVLSDWAAVALHERFLQFCVQHELYDYVGACYREEKARRGVTDPILEEQLAKWAELVQQQFLVRHPMEGGGHSTGKAKLLLTIGFLLFAGFLFYLMMQAMFQNPLP